MKKLPLLINTEIFVQSLEHKLARAKSRILGGRHGDFIIIDNPILQLSNRLTIKLTGKIQCKFRLEGEVYDFLSMVRKHTEDGFCLIDYPQDFQQSRLRSHPRIRVNIETRLLVDQQRDTLTVSMTDISAGGCKLMFPYLFGVPTETSCTLSFSLPDGKNVENLKGIIRTNRMMKLGKKTEVGIKFLEPDAELEKVASFCRFCMFFDV
jgi:c-di-GMP-binding flagellar brake protein YcgR